MPVLPKTLDIPPLGPNIKSTVNGILSAAIAILIAVSALPNGVKWPVVALAVLRAVGGIMTKDAGVTEAVTTTGEVKAVPSHEVPDDPTSTPVAEAQPEPLHSATVVKGPRVS